MESVARTRLERKQEFLQSDLRKEQEKASRFKAILNKENLKLGKESEKQSELQTKLKKLGAQKLNHRAKSQSLQQYAKLLKKGEKEQESIKHKIELLKGDQQKVLSVIAQKEKQIEKLQELISEKIFEQQELLDELESESQLELLITQRIIDKNSKPSLEQREGVDSEEKEISDESEDNGNLNSFFELKPTTQHNLQDFQNINQQGFNLNDQPSQNHSSDSFHQPEVEQPQASPETNFEEYRERISELESWSEIGERGVEFSFKGERGYPLQIRVTENSDKVVTVHLTPSDMHDQITLWRDKQRIKEQLEQAGIKVKEILVSGRNA